MGSYYNGCTIGSKIVLYIYIYIYIFINATLFDEQDVT